VITRLVIALCLGFFITVRTASAQPAPASTPPAPAPGQAYAVLVGGLGGQDPYGKWYADWLARFQTYLTQSARVPAANVALLSGKDATFEAITAAFGKLAARAGPQDQLVLFIVGHGEINGTAPTLSLAGPDPTARQLGALLNAFPAKNQVILNFSASSGDFLKVLSAPGRVNLTATSPTELEEPVFPEFFLRGLESKRAGAGKNGPITMLEAYNWAAQQTALWIGRWQQTGDPEQTDFTQWKASGRETVEIFEKLYSSLPTRKLDPDSDRNAPDAPVDLVPPGGEITADWASRRVVDEHAMLEDCGQGIGVSVVTDKGFQPILGQKQGDPGYLAAHTVLGQPALIP